MALRVLPLGALTLDEEISRGSFGVVCNAVLYRERVCAKVRRVARVRRLQRRAGGSCFRAGAGQLPRGGRSTPPRTPS
jgi:hypothetical protein